MCICLSVVFVGGHCVDVSKCAVFVEGFMCIYVRMDCICIRALFIDVSKCAVVAGGHGQTIPAERGA